MERIDGPGSVNGGFVGGNPVLEIEGTVVTPKWANDVQEELCSVIEGEGLTLTEGDRDQLYEAIILAIDRKTGGVLDFTAGGSLTAGDPHLEGDTFGVVVATVTLGNPAQLRLRGTYTLPKAAGTAWAPGDALYWNGSALTTVSSGNRLAGIAAAAALSAATTGDATLTGPPNL